MLIGALTTVALATPQLLTGTDEARARRRARVDVLARDVEVRSVDDLVRSDEPYLVHAEPETACPGPPSTNRAILRLVTEAEELRMLLRPDASMERLVEAQTAWRCLGEPADATLGARLHFLLGVARHARGDVDAARSAFEAALRSDPGLRWDPDFAPEARPLFDALAAADRPEPHAVTVVPADAPVTLRLDGRSVAIRRGIVEVSPGRHLLQVDADTTWWVDVRRDDWIVIPRYLRDTLVDRVDAPETRSQIAGLVDDVPGPVFVPSSRVTWRLDDGSWTSHRAPLTRRVSRPLAVSGAVVTVAGAGWMLAESLARGRRNERIDGALDDDGYADIASADAAARTRYRLAGALTVGGVLATGLGVTWVVTTW